MKIGSFRKTRGGYLGRLQILTLDVELRIVQAAPGHSENAPDWRVLLGEGEDCAEVGAGWNHRGEKAGVYIAVQLDCPTFARPIRANLLPPHGDEDHHGLLWTPRHRRRAAGRS